MSDDAQKQQAHPLESLFNIEAGSTPTTQVVPITDTGALVNPQTGEVVEQKVDGVTIDDLDREERVEDIKIGSQIEVIHEAALDAFEQQNRLAKQVDPKFSARNAEVAAQYLKIALDAVSTRVDAKHKRAKVQLAKQNGSAPRQVQNNVIFADRNDLLRAKSAGMGGIFTDNSVVEEPSK